MARARVPGVELPDGLAEERGREDGVAHERKGGPPIAARPEGLLWVALVLAMVVDCGNSSGAGRAWAAATLDPAQVVPLDQIAPEHRETVSEVIRDHTFHRLGESETFPCHGSLYLNLLE